MQKLVVVKNNIVKKIVVTKDPSDVPLFDQEELKSYPKRKIKEGDKYDGFFKVLLKSVGIK